MALVLFASKKYLYGSRTVVRSPAYHGTRISFCTDDKKVEQIWEHVHEKTDDDYDPQFMGDSFSNPLHAAVQDGHESAVRRLLTRGIVNSLDGRGYTSDISSLQLAAKIGHLGITAMLLEAGAHINHKDSERKTALIYASEEGHSKVVSRLLLAGADINSADREGLTPLHCATRYGKKEVVELLLKADANVDALNKEGRTALADISFLGDVAAWNGDLSITLLLLEAKTDLTMGGGKYMTPLQLAARFGTTNEVRAILDAGADVNARGGYYETPLQAVCDRPPLASAHATIDLLLERGADVHITGGACHTALFAAAGIGDIEAMSRLLVNGADVNYTNVMVVNGISANVTALGIAAQHNRKDAVEMLLHLGSNPDCYTVIGHPALISVSEFGGDEIFLALMKAGANVNMKSIHGDTALQTAARTGSYSKVFLLLEAGAIIRDSDSSELLYAAVEGGNLNVFQVLKARVAPSSKRGKENATTLMHTAALHGHVAMTRQLLKLRRDAIHIQDETGKNPLHLAAMMGHSRIVNILVNAGSNVHAQDRTRMTPLHLAAEDGDEEIVKILLRLGADPNARDRSGRTPSKVAVLKGHVHVSTLLLNLKTPRKLRQRRRDRGDIVAVVRYVYLAMMLVLIIFVLRNRWMKS
jgi:ankyrin